MTCYYLDLGSASDLSCPTGILLQPIRSTNQMWVVKRHQYAIAALFSQTSFRGEFGRKFFHTKLLSRLSHKIFFPACYGTAFNPFLNFESVDKYLWGDKSNEASLTVLSHGATCFSAFYNLKFWILASFNSERVDINDMVCNEGGSNFRDGDEMLK